MYDNETTPLNDNFDGLRVTNEMKRNWLSTSKWARFFAILGFVIVGLYLLLLGSLGAIFETLSALSGNPMLGMMVGPMMTYIMVFIAIMLLVQAAYHYYHLRFANDMKNSLEFTDQTAFEQSWKNLRNHFRIFGILIIVVLVFYVIAIGVVAYMAASMPSEQLLPTE